MTSLYANFTDWDLTEEQRIEWQTGTLCNFTWNINGTVMYCPMPFNAPQFTACCEDECCIPPADNSYLYGIAVGVSSVLVCMLVCSIICVYNKYYHKCVHNSDTRRRGKIKIYASKNSVRPVDKRLLLKTGNYTVEKNWDQVVVKFHNESFFANFIKALSSRYKELDSWRVGVEQIVTSSEGAPICLKEVPHSQMIIVTLEANVKWVMNDFQNICKNVTVTECLSDKSRKRLTPRLPTIGEEFYDAGDFQVKICQTEVEIKFIKRANFDKFKYVLLAEYPTASWSKYQQRDCTQVKVESGKTVTIHLWEGIQSIWLSGDGKKEWYTNTFDHLWEKVKKGYKTGSTKIPKGFETTNGVILELTSKNKEIPTVYTVKTLDTGGFEIEFPSVEFLPLMKSLLEITYPKVIWKEYSCRSVSSIEVSNSCHISVHISTPMSFLRKMWIYEESCVTWFNTIFKLLYASAYTKLHPEFINHTTEEKELDPHICPVEETAII